MENFIFCAANICDRILKRSTRVFFREIILVIFHLWVNAFNRRFYWKSNSRDTRRKLNVNNMFRKRHVQFTSFVQGRIRYSRNHVQSKPLSPPSAAYYGILLITSVILSFTQGTRTTLLFWRTFFISEANASLQLLSTSWFPGLSMKILIFITWTKTSFNRSTLLLNLSFYTPWKY